MDTEATTALRTEEVRVAQEMIDRVEARHAITPHRLAADTAYGSGPTLSWLVEEKGIEPHIPVWGRIGARDELLLAATARNLRKLPKLIWKPPITGAVCPG